MTTTNTKATTTPDPAQTMAKQIVCIDLSISRPGTRRKVDTGTVNKSDAKDERLHVSKTVLKSERLDDVNEVTGKARRYMMAQALPMSMYRNGLYPISLGRLEEIPAELDKLKTEFDAAVEAFLDEYAPNNGKESAIIAADREALNSLFETSDYPTRDEMRKKFGFEYFIMAQHTPESIKSISQSMYTKEAKRAQDRLRIAADELIVGLRLRFKDLVDHMVDRLSPNAVGEKKKFHSANIDKLSSFLKSLKTDNVLGDDVINGLAEKASSLLEGLDVKSMKDDETYQGQVLQSFTELKSQLDAVSKDAERSFDFTE